MRRRGLILSITLIGATPLALGAASMARANDPAVSDMTVNIDNFAFSPGELVVPVGTKITWENRDDIPHTVTDAATQRAFKSPALDTGEAFSHVFGTAGTWRYFCSLHPHMQGTVVVR